MTSLSGTVLAGLRQSTTLGTTLESLTDVDTTGKVAGNILYWTGTQWAETSTSTFVADLDLGNFSTFAPTNSVFTITGGGGAIVGSTSLAVDSDVIALANHRR